MTLHAEILEKNGKKQFAVLPYEEFVAMQQRLEDLEDLAALRRAKRAEGGKRSIPLAEAKCRLGLA
jgi:PHD/YefM family antitoxin component YafN of YafNO toxin-antitoxin module